MTHPIKLIVSEDIFTKAAVNYCDRIGVDPLGYVGDFNIRLNVEREILANLAERINALKAVGAI